MTRQLKREVKIGNIKIGGTNPIAVQTMLNVPVKDIAGNVAQAKRVAAAGCQIVRATVLIQGTTTGVAVELDGKNIDCVWNGMTLTDEVTNAMACTNPYCSNSQVVVTAAK